MDTPENTHLTPGQIADRIKLCRSGDLEEARQRGHYARVDTEDEIYREVIETLRGKQRTDWNPGTESHRAADAIIKSHEQRIAHNKLLRENKLEYPDLSPGDTAQQDQIRAAVANDKLGVAKLACLLCYAMEALPQTAEKHKEMWLDAAERLKLVMAEAEKTGGHCSEGFSAAVQTAIDASFFRVYAGTMFNSEESIGNEISSPGDGVASAVQQASVCSLLSGTPEAAMGDISEILRITDEEAERLLDITEARA